MKFLIIEDDHRTIEVVEIAITIRWPKAIILKAHKGKEGIDLISREEPDIVILDLGLPDMDGLDVLKEIKTFSDALILILSARNDEGSIVGGLELGADEYITKPFRQMEFLARIQCLLRRKHGEIATAPIVIGPFNYLPSLRRLTIGDKDVILTTTEALLFEKLATNKNLMVSKEILAQCIWGDDYPGSAEAIHVYVRRLRLKIESDPANPNVIINVPGAGYYLKISE